MKYIQADIEEIMSCLEPVNIFGEYITLRQAGKSVKGLCPFHHEKTPSFSVNADNGLWHCFGCGKGGNLMQFVMEIEHISFSQAVELLAGKAGIALKPVYNDKKTVYEKDDMRRLLEKAALAYHHVLVSTKAGAKAKQYLLDRGISIETIDKFKIGYAPASNGFMEQLLKNRNISVDHGIKTGLLGNRKDGRGYYDYFRNRIMIPITDLQGRFIAFGGRTLDSEQPAKYINSPETPLYKKGLNLFALSLAKKSIDKEGEAVIVEGYFDAILPHQTEISNVVASLGTALTEEQLKLLRRYCTKLVLVFDPDSAGIRAVDRVLPIAEKLDFDLRVAALPNGCDPDLFIRKYGDKVFKECIEKAEPLLGYQLSRFLSLYPHHTPEGKAKVVNDFIPWLSRCNNIVVREEYIRKLADALHLHETLVRSYFAPSRKVKNSNKMEKIVIETPIRGWERDILKVLINNPETAEKIFNVLVPENFCDERVRQIIELYFNMWQEKEKLSVEDVCGNISLDSMRCFVTELALLNLSDNIDVNSVLPALIERVKEEGFKDRMKELKFRLDDLLEAGKVGQSDEIFQEYQELVYYFKKGR